MDAPALGPLRRHAAALPLFPLPDVVFIPSTLLPLHVFEPRFRALVADCLESGDGVLAVPRLMPGYEADYEGDPRLFPVSGAGRIVRHQELGDGRHNVIVLGLARVRLRGDARTARGYRAAEVEILEDRLPPGGLAALSAGDRQLRALAAQIMSTFPAAGPTLTRAMESGGGTVELIDKLAHLTLRTPSARQEYLECLDVGARLDTVLGELAGLLAGQEAFDA